MKGESFLTLDIIFALIAFGEPRSGKGKFFDWVFEHFKKNHFFCWSGYSAIGHEAMFPMVNMNCRDAWYEEIQKHPGRKHELPSCMCHTPMKVLVMKPNYTEIDKKSYEYGINVTWKDWKEYNEAYEKGLVKEYIAPWHWESTLDACTDRLFKKPKKMYPKQLFKTFDFTPPIIHTNPGKRVEQFREDMLKAVAICKSEDRPLINSPSMFPTDEPGRKEKFSTPAEFLKFTQDTLAKHELFKVYDGDPESATPAQLANHKKFYMFNELRAMCPSVKLSGDKFSSVSKREMYNFMPERRHAKTWIGADGQSPDDIFDGVRKQFSSLKVFKRITPDLIGAENEKFFYRLDKLCNTYYENWGLDPTKYIPTKFKLGLLKRYHICRLAEMPDNYYCIKKANGDFQIKEVLHASFHHKDDSQDEITEIIGSDIVVNDSLRGIVTPASSKIESVKESKAEGKTTVMLRIKAMFADKITYPNGFPDIAPEIAKLEASGAIPDYGNGKLSPKALNNKYNLWLGKQA
jgi:hypothetical protein